MKISSATILTTTFTLGLARPHARNTASITFIGAANAQFSQDFPTDGSIVHITNPLSISKIASNTDGVSCTFNGIDHSVTTVSGVETVDVGPPQTQIQGSCTTGSSAPPSKPPTQPVGSNEVLITFLGAANAQFTQPFPTDGTETKITDPLSISHIVSTTSGVTCSFNGIDHSVTAINGAGMVDVGPPQTQISGVCHA